MDKYITLEGLGHFLNTIKSDKFLALDTCYGCIKTGYNGGQADTINKNYPVKLDNGKAFVNVPWTNNKVTSVDNHYQQKTKPTKDTEGLYNITIDAAGHITKSSNPQKNNFAEAWPELNELIYKSIDYETLKAARNNNSLAAGRLYRITDYQATSDSNYLYTTKNPGRFDIIVEAISTSSISETAWVCHHEGDTYFSECELDKWKIKYCIDNDVNRFEWANKMTGKGVIYYMKDEWGNEAPYDFKNLGPGTSNSFLFNNSKNHDASVKGYKFDQTETELPRENNIFPTNNILKPKYSTSSMETIEALNIRFGCVDLDMLDNFTGISNNYVDYNCSSVSFSPHSPTNSYDGSNGYGCHNNIIGRDCNNISIFNSNNNEIGAYSEEVYLSNCDNTKIGYGCSGIHFIYDVVDYNYGKYDINALPSSTQKSKNNIIGNHLSNIFIGMDCNNNIFENYGGGNDSYLEESVLGHQCNNNLIKTNSWVNFCYGYQTGGSDLTFLTMNGVENCIFNKCINSQIVVGELGKFAQQDTTITTINIRAIGSFYFDNGTPLYDRYKFKNFEFVNISRKYDTHNSEYLVYDGNNNNISNLPNYVSKLKGMFDREYRTLAKLKSETNNLRKLQSACKYD